MMTSTANEKTWTDRWYGFLSGLGTDLRRARSLARRHRLRSIEVQFGRILAEVDDRERDVCSVKIEVVRLEEEAWSTVLDALAGEALYAAQLLAGDTQLENVCTVLDTVFAGTNVTLMPAAEPANDIVADCSLCRRQMRPCRHALVVLHLFGQLISEDPWLLLRLRGRDRQQLLSGLRFRRSDGAGSVSGHSEGALPAPLDQNASENAALHESGNLMETNGDDLALAAQLDSFWGRRPSGPEATAQDWQSLHFNIGPPLIRMALLRRLGPPPFPLDSMDVYERLAHIYDTVSTRALELAFAPEPGGDGAR